MESSKMTRRAKKIIIGVILGAILLFWFLVSVFPFIWTTMTSLKTTIDAISIPPVWLFEPTWDYYAEVWANPDFLDAFGNSIIVSVSSVCISIGIGAPCAYALARSGSNSSFFLLCLSLVFRALPRMVFIVPYYYIATALGIYDTEFLLVMVMVSINQPFTIWMLRSFFMTIPHSLDEAAMVDGCTRFQAFRKVIVPIMGTGIVTSAIFTLLLAYNEFMLPSALTSTNATTLPVMISQFGTENIRYWSVSAAGSISIAVPIIIITLVLQKYLVRGMTSGSVKE